MKDKKVFEDDPERDNNAVISSIGMGKGNLYPNGPITVQTAFSAVI